MNSNKMSGKMLENHEIYSVRAKILKYSLEIILTVDF